MTAGRKTMKPAVVNEPDLDQERIDNAMVVMREQAISAEDQVRSEIYELGEAIGTVKAFGFVATVANHSAVTQFEKVKKSKAWQYLADPNSATRRNFESLDEYCQAAFGKSYRRMMDLSSNLRLLGQEVYDQAEQLGLGQRDYNAIKALPAQDQEVVRRAIEEAQSRDEVIDLLQEMAGRHVREKEAADKRIADLEADNSAGEERRGELLSEIETIRDQQRRIKRATPDVVLADLHKEATAIALDALGAIRGNLRQASVTLIGHHDEHGGDSLVFLGGLVSQIEAELVRLRDEFGLPSVDAGEHGWIDGED